VLTINKLNNIIEILKLNSLVIYKKKKKKSVKYVQINKYLYKYMYKKKMVKLYKAKKKKIIVMMGQLYHYNKSNIIGTLQKIVNKLN
jgi:hypothetical protein